MTIKEQASNLRNQYVDELRETEMTLDLLNSGLNLYNVLDEEMKRPINNIKKDRKWNIGLLIVWSILLPLNAINGNFLMVGLSAFWLGLEGYFTYKNTMKLKDLTSSMKEAKATEKEMQDIKELLQSRQRFIERQIEKLTDVAHSNGTIKEEELQSIKQSLQKLKASEYYNPYENVIDVIDAEIVER